MDALREVSNIGTGHAATAFARMLGGRVLVSVPQSAQATSAEITARLGGDPDLVTISFAVQGGAEAFIILAFSAQSARSLGAAMVPGSEPLGDDAFAAITEMGNILASAYLNAVGRLAQMTLVPSIPELALGDQNALAERLRDRAPEIVVESAFEAHGGALGEEVMGGKVLLLGTRESLGPLLRSIGLSP